MHKPSNSNHPLFTPLEDLELSESIVMCVYGASGSGKTHFAGSAGFEGRAAMLNIGGGIATLRNAIFRQKYPLAEKMIVATIHETMNPKVATGYNQCEDAVRFLFNQRLDDWDTLIVDDMTALRRFALNLALEINQKGDRSKTKATFEKDEIALVTVADFGTEMQLTEKFILELIGLCKEANKHLICTAHERNNYGKAPSIGAEQPVTKTMPGFTGKTFPDSVTGHFDITWHAEVVGGGANTHRQMRTVGSESITVNTKLGGLFKEIERDIDFPEVLRRVKEGKLLDNSKKR